MLEQKKLQDLQNCMLIAALKNIEIQVMILKLQDLQEEIEKKQKEIEDISVQCIKPTSKEIINLDDLGNEKKEKLLCLIDEIQQGAVGIGDDIISYFDEINSLV